MLFVMEAELQEAIKLYQEQLVEVNQLLEAHPNNEEALEVRTNMRRLLAAVLSLGGRLFYTVT